jgi:hypothetical protein
MELPLLWFWCMRIGSHENRARNLDRGPSTWNGLGHCCRRLAGRNNPRPIHCNPLCLIIIGTEGFQRSGGHNSPVTPLAR